MPESTYNAAPAGVPGPAPTTAPGSGQTVYLGMSGGVDSALAAALLLEQGYRVHAVYMRNWSRDLPGFKCTWADDLADAERVAVTLGIDLDVWDCEAEYKSTVVDYLVDAYAHGLTPNPDVMCNQTVKFGTFARRAFAEGADFVATGHYARVSREPATAPGAPARTRLLRAADEHKDQTYFLWRVPEATLSRTLFPIGDIPTKAQVRRMCAERGLGVEAKPDSDGICFIGPVGIRTFLLDTLERRAGDIVEWETGRVIGHHDGAFLFTVGQRKGLGIGGGPKRYVVATDVVTNTVFATADPACPALWTRRVLLTDVRWVHGEPPAPGDYLVRSRHTGDLRPAHVTPFSPAPSQQTPADNAGKTGNAGEKCGAGEKGHAGEKNGASVLVEYAEPVRTVAPGQSAVIYDGLECLGGGIIARPELCPPSAGALGRVDWSPR